ncbi:hypothetical protein ON010_g5209 [Phytophthora cinnamomi]|nr:hypothetical protein ON010_g5209 [Phytophthora cinnamomi]
MPEKFRDAINDDAQTVLEELFFLPMCVDISPQLLGEAAAYIATWNNGKDFKFKWCSPSPEGHIFNERTASTYSWFERNHTFAHRSILCAFAEDALRSYRSLQRWKKSQQAEFDALVKSSSSFEGDETAKLKEAFKPQLGGLRLDPSGILNEAEFTKKTEEDSKEWIKTGKTNGGGYRSNGQKSSRRDDRSSDSTSSRRYRDDEPRIKEEIRYQVSDQDNDYPVVEAAVNTNGTTIGHGVEIVVIETDMTMTTMMTVIGIVKAADVMTSTARATNIRATTEMTGNMTEMTGATTEMTEATTEMIGSMTETTEAMTDAIPETSITGAILRISTVVSVNLIATAGMVIVITTVAATAAVGAGRGAHGNPRGAAGNANETIAAEGVRTVGAAALAEVTAETVVSTIIEAKTPLHRRLREVRAQTKEASTKPVVRAGGMQSGHALSRSAARPSVLATG